jgi:hypothetical protein
VVTAWCHHGDIVDVLAQARLFPRARHAPEVFAGCYKVRRPCASHSHEQRAHGRKALNCGAERPTPSSWLAPRRANTRSAAARAPRTGRGLTGLAGVALPPRARFLEHQPLTRAALRRTPAPCCRPAALPFRTRLSRLKLNIVVGALSANIRCGALLARLTGAGGGGGRRCRLCLSCLRACRCARSRRRRDALGTLGLRVLRVVHLRLLLGLRAHALAAPPLPFKQSSTQPPARGTQVTLPSVHA